MSKKENAISMFFKSNLKYTELSVLVLAFIKKILEIGDDEFFKIEISLREAINNAIVHGNQNDLTKLVFVEFIWEKSFLRMRIRDEGKQKINLNQILEKINSCGLLSSNGRGIMIIKSYMDKFEFRCLNRGSEVLMEKKLS
ncbi:MAG: ATP-binding protein [Candidatus Aminicenantes bacterium]|nr:ATP-binding protein [Candidatus Aminicenantes bacterium]